MMKRTAIYRFIIAVLLCLLLLHCSKDKGNYTYQSINKLNIVDQEDKPINKATYYLTLGEVYSLIPKITGSITGVDSDQLLIYWIIGQDTVSNDKTWKINASSLGTGIHLCKLLVIDKLTSLSYTNAFSISVQTGIQKGSLILTANEQQESSLTMRGEATKAPYLYWNSFDNIKLGKQPIDIDVTYLQPKDGAKTYQQVMVTTEEGEFPIFTLDFLTLRPMLSFAAQGSVLSGELLRPSYYLQEEDGQLDKNQFNGQLLINGKCHSLERGIISDDLYRADPLNYDFGDRAVVYNGKFRGFLLAGFDSRNQRIRVFHNAGEGGVYKYNYDRAIPAQLTVGHSFVAARSFIAKTSLFEDINWQFLTRKADQIQLTNIISTYFIVQYATVVATKSVPEMVDGVGFRFHDGYWYFGKGRTIYRFAATGLNIEPFLTLPADQSGDIATWNFFKNTASQLQKIGIATYDSSSSQTHKGSYYLYDIPSKQYQLQDPNVIDRAVDIELCF